MFEIRFSRAPRVRSRRWNNPTDPINILKSFTSDSDQYSGWVFVKNAVTGETIHKQFICG